MAANIRDLQLFSSTLSERGIHHALGGSGLMNLLGIELQVHDWDITVDYPEELVKTAISPYEYHRKESKAPFESAYAYRVTVGTSDIDLIGSFAIRVGSVILECATIVTGEYQGIPLGSLEEWEKMYVAMGEEKKVGQIRTHLT